MRTALLKALAVAAVSLAAVATPDVAKAGQSFPDGGTGYLNFACYSAAYGNGQIRVVADHYPFGLYAFRYGVYNARTGATLVDLAKAPWQSSGQSFSLFAPAGSQYRFRVQYAHVVGGQWLYSGWEWGAVSQNGGAWYWGGVCST